MEVAVTKPARISSHNHNVTTESIQRNIVVRTSTVKQLQSPYRMLSTECEDSAGGIKSNFICWFLVVTMQYWNHRNRSRNRHTRAMQGENFNNT